MSAVLTLAYTCDACGTAGPSVSASTYGCPPTGWVWDASRLSEGPHACGEKCWVLLENIHYARTRQRLQPVGVIEAEDIAFLPESAQEAVQAAEAEEAQLTADAEAVAAQVMAAVQSTVVQVVDEVVEEDEDEDDVTAPPQRRAKAKEVPRRKAKAEAPATPGICTKCGKTLPPQTKPGRPRTMCEECNPPKKR